MKRGIVGAWPSVSDIDCEFIVVSTAADDAGESAGKRGARGGAGRHRRQHLPTSLPEGTTGARGPTPGRQGGCRNHAGMFCGFVFSFKYPWVFWNFTEYSGIVLFYCDFLLANIILPWTRFSNGTNGRLYKSTLAGVCHCELQVCIV